MVTLFPLLNTWLVPVLSPFVGSPLILNSLRLLVAFGLLLIPTAAMGAKLPLMVKGLGRTDDAFSSRLGQLYAVNTLGAMAGALCCELIFIEQYGIFGAGCVATGMNLFAALVSLLQGGNRVESTEPVADRLKEKLSWRTKRLLAAAFLCGCTLLALEIAWFRFLQLFSFGTSRVFVYMLAIVLCGIATGGMFASRTVKKERALTVRCRSW